MTLKTEIKQVTTLHLIEVSSMLHRAYHVAPPLVRPSDGMPCGAIYVFAQMLSSLLRNMGPCTHRVAVMDGGRSGRNKIDPNYKANRNAIDADLRSQFPLARRAIAAFGISVVEAPGYEADDAIATLSRRAAASGASAVIATNDKDMSQLVSDRIEVFDTGSNALIGTIQVLAKYGVEPHQLVDVQALAGDTADNVPGVPGIGIKIAAELIREFGDLDAVLKAAPRIKQPARRTNLIAYADQARICRELVRLQDDVPGLPGIEDLAARPIDDGDLLALCERMELRTLPEKLGLRSLAA